MFHKRGHMTPKEESYSERDLWLALVFIEGILILIPIPRIVCHYEVQVIRRDTVDNIPHLNDNYKTKIGK